MVSFVVLFFDLDLEATRYDEIGDSKQNRIYARFRENVMEPNGFFALQQSTYGVEIDDGDEERRLEKLARDCKKNAPDFCAYVQRVHTVVNGQLLDFRKRISEHASVPMGSDASNPLDHRRIPALVNKFVGP
ncbi:MAG: hypothetical protein Hens2KO_27760 [Henriciella sp.]